MWRRAVVAFTLISAASAALAIDYRSVEVPAAILYDSPSQKGKKLYLIKAQTPVEAVVRLEGWVKVRDAEGTLAWIEARNLGETARDDRRARVAARAGHGCQAQVLKSGALPPNLEHHSH